MDPYAGTRRIRTFRFLSIDTSKLESAEFLRLSHGLILAFVSADPVLGNPIRLA